RPANLQQPLYKAGRFLGFPPPQPHPEPAKPYHLRIPLHRRPPPSDHHVDGEEAVEPDAGDQGAEACPQHLRRGERRSPHSRCQGTIDPRPIHPNSVSSTKKEIN
uniref:Uncharacterized protein n=1 Tax=Triticum urartu TaxID=4572 RepID=A0A8R7P574_TRIUA